MSRALFSINASDLLAVRRQIEALAESGTLTETLRLGASQAAKETRTRADKLIAERHGLKFKDMKKISPVKLTLGDDGERIAWAELYLRNRGINLGRVAKIKPGPRKRIKVSAHKRSGAAVSAYRQRHRVGVKAVGRGKDFLSSFTADEIAKMIVTPRGRVYFSEDGEDGFLKPVAVRFGNILDDSSAAQTLKEYAAARLKARVIQRIRWEFKKAYGK